MRMRLLTLLCSLVLAGPASANLLPFSGTVSILQTLIGGQDGAILAWEVSDVASLTGNSLGILQPAVLVNEALPVRGTWNGLALEQASADGTLQPGAVDLANGVVSNLTARGVVIRARCAEEQPCRPLPSMPPYAARPSTTRPWPWPVATAWDPGGAEGSTPSIASSSASS